MTVDDLLQALRGVPVSTQLLITVDDVPAEFVGVYEERKYRVEGGKVEYLKDTVTIELAEK